MGPAPEPGRKQEMLHIRYYFGPGIGNADEHGRQHFRPGSKQPSREAPTRSEKAGPKARPSRFLPSGSLERRSSSTR